MVIFVATDLHNASKVCEQPWWVLLCMWRIYSESSKHSLTPIAKKAYELYFGCKVEDQHKPWAPHICCCAFARKLIRIVLWSTGRGAVCQCPECLTSMDGSI